MKYLLTLLLASSALAAFQVHNFQENGKFMKSFSHPLKFHQGSSLKVVGGKEASPHSIPWQVVVTLENSKNNVSWMCGGALISANDVLTAAQCLQGADKIVVTMGDHSLSQYEGTEQTLIVEEFFIHPEFDMATLYSDIALLKLAGPAYISDPIRPVKLPRVGEDYEGQIGRVSGWGLTNGHEADQSDVLMYAESKIISNKECHATFEIAGDSNICLSGKEGASSCSGDTGGPLTVDGVLVGLSSFGVSHCVPGYPSVYSRITSFLPFIKKHADI